MRIYSIFGYSGVYLNGSFYDAYPLGIPWIQDTAWPIYDIELELEDSASGSLKFKIPVGSLALPDYPRPGTIIEVREKWVDELPEIYMADIRTESGGLDVDKIFDPHGWVTRFVGRLLLKTVDTYGNVECTVEGPMCFLKDTRICTATAFNIRLNAYDPLRAFFSNEEMLNLLNFRSERLFAPTMQIDYTQYDCPRTLKVTSVFIDPDITLFNTPVSQLDDFKSSTSYGGIVYSNPDPTNIYDLIKSYVGDFGLFQVDGKPYGSEYLFISVGYDFTDVNPDNEARWYEPQINGLTVNVGFDDPQTNKASRLEQKIVIGSNLKSSTVEYDFSNVATSLMVLGATNDSANPPERYSFASIDPYYSQLLAADLYNTNIIGIRYIDSDNGSIEKYGLMPGTIVLDDLKSPEEVARWAVAYRNIFSNPVVKITLSAVDLHDLYQDIPEFAVGFYYPAFIEGINNGDEPYYYRCTRIRKNLIDPSNDEYEFVYTQGMNLSSRMVQAENNEISLLKKEISALKLKIKDLEGGEKSDG